VCPRGRAMVLGGTGDDSGRHEVAQDVVQDAAVFEVVELVERIDAADQRHPPEPAIGRHDLSHQPLARL